MKFFMIHLMPYADLDLDYDKKHDSAWVTLPNAWANALIAGTAKGIAWGGVSERYQVARKSAVAPFTGCLRITVS